MRAIRRLATSVVVAWCLCACTGEIGDDDTANAVDPGPEYLPADGVTLTEVAIYQGVERVLVKDGAAVAGVSVIAGRDALVRVFYQTDAGYDGAAVLSRLTIGEAAPLEVAGPLGSSSKRDTLGSTIDFHVPGSSITATAGFRVEVLRAAVQTSGKNAAASHPASGQQTLAAISVGDKLKVVLIPIRYLADGSGRLPDTSPEQQQIYRDAIWRMYPTPEVEVRVAEPIDWNGVVKGDGTGWSELLEGMIGYRKSANAAYDEYYYGLFRATDTFGQFCQGTCVAGLSNLVDNPFQAWSRVGVGIGFPGPEVGETAAHEVGHEHGRAHAPCGTAQGVDPTYPHQGGATGAWGYDLIKKQLVAPTDVDFMSYCKPQWISDYTYAALLTRMQTVNNGMMALLGAGAIRRYERVALRPDGSVAWLEPLELDIPPLGAAEPIQLDSDQGPSEVMGHFFPYSHLPGGTVLFASPPARLTRVTVRKQAMSAPLRPRHESP
jgi:hypothetical protein